MKVENAQRFIESEVAGIIESGPVPLFMENEQ
jgi:hypothetical protein